MLFSSAKIKIFYKEIVCFVVKCRGFETMGTKFKMNSNTRLVYVDDDEADTQLVVKNLGEVGFPNVRTANESKTLIELINEFQPHLVFLATMRDHTGYKILEELKAQYGTTRVPVVGIFDGAYKKDWLEIGAFYALPKFGVFLINSTKYIIQLSE